VCSSDLNIFMNATIGVYDTHDKAVEAIKALKDAGIDQRKLSILGKATVTEDNIHIASGEPAKLAAAEVGAAAVLGPVLGVLTGVGLFAIPGLGFLYGAGALVGAIAGFDFGLIGGGIVSAFTILGMKKDRAAEYEKHLQEGKYMVVAQGEQGEINKAKEILDQHGTHLHSEVHI